MGGIEVELESPCGRERVAKRDATHLYRLHIWLSGDRAAGILWPMMLYDMAEGEGNHDTVARIAFIMLKS